MTPQDAVAKNAGAQAAVTVEPRLGLFVAESVVHPITRTTFLDTLEANALDLKFLTDQRVQVQSLGDDVATCAGWMRVRETQLVAQLVEHLPRKEGDLAFVIHLVAEEPIAANALARDAFDFVLFKNRMVTGRLFVMADVVVAWRNEKMADKHQNSLGGQHVLHPRERCHHAGEAERGGGEEGDVADLFGRASGVERTACVAVDCAFAQCAGGNSQLDEATSFRVERASLPRGFPKRFVSPHDVGILLAELLEARRDLLVGLWFGFGFSAHPVFNQRDASGDQQICLLRIAAPSSGACEAEYLEAKTL